MEGVEGGFWFGLVCFLSALSALVMLCSLLPPVFGLVRCLCASVVACPFCCCFYVYKFYLVPLCAFCSFAFVLPPRFVGCLLFVLACSFLTLPATVSVCLLCALRCVFFVFRASQTYRIPLDLHPRLPDPGFTMDRLPGLNKVVSFKVVCRDLNIVPVVTLFRVFQCLFKQGDWFSFSKRCNAEDVCIDDGPSSLKKWKDKFFLIDQCDPVFRRIDDNAEMSIYDFMILPSWSDAKVVEESHHLSLPTARAGLTPFNLLPPAAKGANICCRTLMRLFAFFADSRLAKKPNGPSQARVRSTSDTTPEPSQSSKKRKLKKRASEAGSSAPELDQAC
ncbi:hypothetical protein Tco_1192707 [Tanacetum coccineum]